MNSQVKKLCLASMLVAIAYLLTTFASVPLYTGQAYINFGDGVIMFASIVLGPWWGGLVGILAGSLADLTLGNVMFIPVSIIAKGGEALLVGLLHKKIKWLSYILGTIWMIVSYFFGYLIIYGPSALINSAFDLIQGSVAIIIVILLDKFLAKFIKFNEEHTSQ